MGEIAMNLKQKARQRSRLKQVAPIWENSNKIARHGDSYKHFMIKAAVGMILRKNDHTFTTELEFENRKIADILDLDTFIVYELESNYTKKDMQEKVDNFREYDDVNDIIVFDPQKAPDDLDEIKTWLEDKLVL